MRSTVYHPKVPGEVRQIIEDYDLISPKLADDFWDELIDAIDYATKFPERHHYDASGRRRSNLKRFPYHCLFRTFDDHIRITVVRHHCRTPDLGSLRT